MIQTKEGGFIGTLESADRDRIKRMMKLPNIPYFTLSEQQNFIRNHPIVKGATLNTLLQIQEALAFQNIPFIIPRKLSYDEKWTNQQLEAFAIQGIQVYQNKEDGIPQLPYIYNQIGGNYYLRWKKEQNFSLPRPAQTPPMVTPAVSIAGTTAPPTPTPTPTPPPTTPSRISVFPFAIIGILAIVFIIIWRGRK